MFARPNMDCHVRFGPETTILTKTTDVQLTPKSGHHLIQSQSISSKGVGAGFCARALFASSFAGAQAPQTVRVRGPIEKVDGQTLTVKLHDGNTLAH